MRIDAHQHYWKLDRGEYGWIPEDDAVLHRDYLPEHLAPSLAASGIDRTIVVQAAETLAETDYLLELADRTPSIAGVVGWLDAANPRHAEHYERVRRHPKFAGFRLMIQAMADSAEVLTAPYVEALRFYANAGVTIDLLVVSHQLDHLVALLEQVPGLRGVVDHIAKPRIADGVFEPWASQMAAIAAHPGISCKLSGMVTEADHRAWKQADFTAYIQHVLELFGPSRVLFGSDWPVCLLAASYGQVVDVLEAAIPASWGTRERELLFGGNAAAFYKLAEV